MGNLHPLVKVTYVSAATAVGTITVKAAKNADSLENVNFFKEMDCRNAHDECQGTEEQCDAELRTCLQAFQDCD